MQNLRVSLVNPNPVLATKESAANFRNWIARLQEEHHFTRIVNKKKKTNTRLKIGSSKLNYFSFGFSFLNFFSFFLFGAIFAFVQDDLQCFLEHLA